MRKTLYTLVAVLALAASGCLTQRALADGIRGVRHGKVVRHVCRGPQCGPYAPCGVQCWRPCPNPYECFPLYGNDGIYGGAGYFGAYTGAGWGTRR